MKTNSPKDSAFKSLDVYLSAMQDPDYLRVNKSGDVERASDVVVLFNRANRYLKRAIDKNYSPTDWKSKAYEAITKKLNAEMMSARGKLSQEDTQLLQNLLKNISDSSPSQWQNNISNEISLLKQKNQELAAALEKILFIGRPENSTLFPYVRNQINKSETREGSLELGLAEYLKGEFGYEEVSAKKAAKTMAYVMKNYGSSVKEALSVVSYAGELSLKKAIIAPEKRALPVAFLKLDFGLSLNDANDLYDQINNAKKTIAESKPYIEVMRIFSVGVDKAKLITEKAQEIIDKNTLAPPVSTISSATQKKEALMPAFIQIEVIEAYQIDSNDAKNIYNESRFLKNDWRLKSLSDLQLAEIAWLTSCKKINPEEAILISLRAGRFTDSIPNNRIEQLNKTKNSLNEEINAAFERSSPAGWPDRWELMPDGSRRLTDKKKI